MRGLTIFRPARHGQRMADEIPPPDDFTPPPAAPPAVQGDPPPAAETVANGRLREESLAAELEGERDARRLAETRVSELEDENHRLKDLTPDPRGIAKASWLSGGTFFHA